MNNQHKKSNIKETKKSRRLTEERVREIVREEMGERAVVLAQVDILAAEIYERQMEKEMPS